MKISEIKDMLAEISVPATYSHWTEHEVPELPYICWELYGSSNFAAENEVYQEVEGLSVQLYTEVRDFALEKEVEAVLNKYEIVWDKSSNWIESEAMNETDYTADVLIEPEAEKQEEDNG